MANLIKRGSLLVVFLLFAFSSVAFAEPVTDTIAEEVGSTFLKAQDGIERSIFEKRDAQRYENHSISTVTELKNDATGDLLAYVFALEPKGFVVVSPDTDITPIIAYSFEGNFNWEDSENNVLLDMLAQDMQNRLEALSVISQDLKNKNDDLWVKYFSEDSTFLSNMTDSATYGPLLSTTWYQSSPYNTYCPTDPDTSSTSIVGCVATAMAQIVNYHACTSSVTFTSSDNYTTSTRGISITASSANMSSISYPASTDTAARLSYACGVATWMDYTSSSSGTATSYVAAAFTSKFGFTSATAYAPQSGYGVPVLATFYNKLQDNIQSSQPTQFAITGTGVGGHSIVCDGYNSTTGQYHLNYGWGSSSPTPPWWYTLPAGMPAGYDIVKYGILDIKSTSHPSCPLLYSWNGKNFVYEDHLFTDVYKPEDEYDQTVRIKGKVDPDDNYLIFKIVEVEGEMSFINKVALYVTVPDDESESNTHSINSCNSKRDSSIDFLRINELETYGTRLALISAVHSVLGDVTWRLDYNDHVRLTMFPGEKILLRFEKPSSREEFKYSIVSSGYYIYGNFKRED